MRSVRGALVLAFLLASTAVQASAGQVIFLVRHAEKAAAPAGPTTPQSQMMANDPPLSAAGEARAAKLAAMLKSAGIGAIYTTEFKRTRQTAAPLAEALKLKPVMAAAKDPDPLVARLRASAVNALVVGHSNSVPELLKKLGVKEAVTIGDNDYDDLFIVFRSASGPPTLVRLKY